MITSVNLETAQATLKEMVLKLVPGEEIFITDDEKPIARLVCERSNPTQRHRPAAGLLKGRMLHMAADFNEPLDDLKEYAE